MKRLAVAVFSLMLASVALSKDYDVGISTN